MDLDRLDPQVIIILVIMVVGGIRWFLEQVKGSQEGPSADERADDELEDLYEEARREILSRQTTLEEPPPLEREFEPVLVPCNPRFRVWFNFTVENVRQDQVNIEH